MSLQEGPLKLIRGDTNDDVRHPARHPWELYDLSSDPGETENLVDSRPEAFDKLRENMARIEETLRAGAVTSGGESSLSPELLDQLQELGYVGGGGK
jgi:arylsulfatase A-like enzyme